MDPIGGLVCMVIGVALMLAIPAAKQIDHHRRIEAHPMMAPIARAVPIPEPDDELEALVRRAQEALDNDALTRGLRGVGDAYDEA